MTSRQVTNPGCEPVTDPARHQVPDLAHERATDHALRQAADPAQRQVNDAAEVAVSNPAPDADERMQEGIREHATESIHTRSEAETGTEEVNVNVPRTDPTLYGASFKNRPSNPLAGMLVLLRAKF